MVYEKRVTELTLSEFLSYGPQREAEKVGKKLLRKTKEGKIVSWSVESDEFMCTLQEAFQKVNPRLGFNIELKLDDHIVYQEDCLVKILRAILQIVLDFAGDRPVLFSSFHPDAALLVRKLQSTYPVSQTPAINLTSFLFEKIGVNIDHSFPGVLSYKWWH